MSEIVPAREANQNFSRLLQEVEKGQDFVVTKNGKPVARMTPIEEEQKDPTVVQKAARARMLKIMSEGWSLGGKAPSRDDLYDR